LPTPPNTDRLNQNLPADLSGVAHLSAVALAKAEAESEDLSKAGSPAALFGGLARHPLGGLKDSACPPLVRHSCGGFVWRVHSY